MIRILVRAAVAALSLVFAGLAQAVPIYFDFTGTINGSSDGSRLGEAVSGGFTFEVDDFISFESPPDWYQYSWYSDTPVTAGPMAFVNLAGGSATLPTYEQFYSYVAFLDGCHPECVDFVGEGFDFGAVSYDPSPEGFTGDYRSNSVGITNLYYNPLPYDPYFEKWDAFDGEHAVPLDLATLPLQNLTGFYSESNSRCVNGECVALSSTAYYFNVDTVSRGVGPRPVPEPGTPLLFGAALAGLFFLRRPTSVSPR